MRPPHPLLDHLLAAAEGRFPPVDGAVTVLPRLPRGQSAVVSFTGHAVIATGLPHDAVTALGPDGFGGATRPDVLAALAGPGGTVGTIDVTLVARGRDGSSAGLHPTDGLDDHPRVRHARALRDDVRVYADDVALVTLAAGLAGRRELSVELIGARAGHGAGRRAIEAALGLVPVGEPVFAGVAPGNARSLRAFLAAGFVPIASESVILATT